MTTRTSHSAAPALRAPAVTLPLVERETDILAVLGRLGMVQTQVLYALLFADRSRRCTQHYTRRLVQRGHLWRSAGPAKQATDAAGREHPVRIPDVVGLTPKGRAELERMSAGLAGGTGRFIARGGEALPLLSMELDFDLTISSWCASVIDMARRAPTLVGVHCQAHATVGEGAGRTLGALLTLVFDPAQRTYPRPGWQIPWSDGAAVPRGGQAVRLALEVDLGWVARGRHAEQAQQYARLTASGAFDALGGEVRPVILTRTDARAAHVAEEWAAGWPETPAVVASVARAQHPQYGALWGSYATVQAPSRATTLLEGIVASAEDWGALIAPWSPGALPPSEDAAPSSVTPAT